VVVLEVGEVQNMYFSTLGAQEILQQPHQVKEIMAAATEGQVFKILPAHIHLEVAGVPEQKVQMLQC
jgi:hypothetical protein